MERQHKFYINNLFFDAIYDSAYYDDRPEFYRTHEKSLWTIYQLLRSDNKLVITDNAGVIEKRVDTPVEFKNWVDVRYPKFSEQLNKSLYTKYPHPNDILEK